MVLWGNIDYQSGNNKPKYANTSNIAIGSTSIGGSKANTDKYWGRVLGVSATEAANTTGDGKKVVHPGWVSQKIGTGPIASVAWTGGVGYNSGGYLLVTDTSAWKRGAAANIRFTIANSRNTMQGSSVNAHWNVINSFVVSGGSGWSSPSEFTYQYGGLTAGRPMSNATFTLVLGGRAGRKTYETLVAMGSITGDDPQSNTYFPGI